MNRRVLAGVLMASVAAGLLALGALDDKFINSRGSIFLNIDSDNNDSFELLRISRNAPGSAGTNLVTVRESGHVGIGTTNPLAQLHVTGDGTLPAVFITNGGAPALVVSAFTTGNSVELSGKIQVAGTVTFTAPDFPGPDPMIHLFDSGTANHARMVIAHSPAFQNWGLQYQDADDLFHFLGNGISAMTVDLGDHRVGIGTASPQVKLHLGNFPDASLTGGGAVVFGSTTGGNIVIDNNEIMARNNGATSTLFLNADGGNVTISPAGTGKLIVPVIEITGADLAERFPVTDDVTPGLVVAIDPDRPGHLRLARGAYNRRVAGVVSGANGLPTGAILGNLAGQEGTPAIALSGRVWVRCDAGEHPIAPGDLLTTSERPGHAMKVTDHARAHGACLGKAMTPLESGTGLVLVLVSLH